MKIERKKKWRVGLGVAVAVVAGWTTWLAAVPGPGTGHSFTTLASPFTQDLYATTGNLPPGGILGGVAFAPDGRVWSAECNFLGTRLHRFANATTPVNGSSVHQEELVVDLTTGPVGSRVGGCSLVNHPDGSMYSSSTAGIWQLNATTGQPIAGPFGQGGNGLGIAVDPQAGHHLVYVGNDCHPSLDQDGTTCTLWDLDPVTHISLVFARLTRAEFMLIDGLYFDPSGNFLFAAHRQVDLDNNGVRTEHNSLQIIRRPAALLAVNVSIDDTQSLPLVEMDSEPDGVAFHVGDGFVVTLNESGDCVNDSTHQVVKSNPTTHQCPAGTTISGTMTRFDFAGADYTQVPTATTFASGGFRGDLMQVGADGCIYATQAPLVANGGTLGTRYDNDVTTGDNSLVQICGGFVPPPGVTHESGTAAGSIAGLVFLDANHNGMRDPGEGALANVPVTLSTDPTHSVSSLPDGTFLFDQLAAGTYTVTTPATATYLGGSIILSTAGSSGAFSLAAGEQKTGLEFGYAPGSVAGTVFLDVNHDAVRNSGEPPLGGVTVTLAGAAGGTAISAADGSYKFNLLASGAYTVTAPATAGGATTGTLVLTTVGSRDVTLAPGEDKTDVDFGYAPPLTIACLSPETGQVGVAYSGSAVASGGLAPYTYAIVGTLPAGLTLNAATGEISGTPTATGGSFSVTVTDATGASASTATSGCPVNGGGVTIAPAPLAVACVSPATGQVGVAYSGSAVASGGVLPYTYAIVGTLPAGLTLNTATGEISGTPTATGSFSVTVTDSNSQGASTATSACSVTIAPAPPALSCVAATTGRVGAAYSSSLVATGGAGAPYNYSIISGSLPNGLALNASTGAITGTPTTAGPFAFTAQVVDARGTPAGTTTSSSCGITIAPAPPALSCVAVTTGQVGVAYNSSLVATGGAGAPYTYSIIAGSLPLGLTLNASTGAITGTPTTAGPFAFTAQVVDARGTDAGTSTSSSCGITIAPAPLTIACLSPATGQVGVAYSGSAVASGGVAPYTYAIVGTLPAGLTLNAATGQISGTPTATGSFSVKVTDSNGAGASTATSACSVAIAPAALTISCVSPATGQVGVAYSGSAVASGGVLPYTYAIVGTLPAGLTLNTATGQISGTPTATGSFSVKVTDSNGAGASTATSACSVAIAPAALTISCVSPATGQVGVAYSGNAVASGGVAPYTYAIVGTLPAGLTLNAATGQISGTPTATGSFSVKVTDSNGAGASTATSACSVTIAPAAPTLACVAATTGQVGVAYNSSLVATGGLSPYTYSIISGSLPTGLTLNASSGAITGTPTAAGSFPFTARVVDSRGTAAGTTTGSCGVAIATSAAAYATYTQGGWGAPPNGNNPGMLLRNNFATVYPNGVTVGGSPYYLKFTSQSAIEAFLPAGGKPGVLNKSATNPTSSSANVFAGQVLALRLSVDFSNAGIITGGLAAVRIATGNPLAGSTVAQVLALANQVIAGNTSALPSGMSVSTLNDVVSRINQNYDNGTTNNGFLVP